MFGAFTLCGIADIEQEAGGAVTIASYRAVL